MAMEPTNEEKLAALKRKEARKKKIGAAGEALTEGKESEPIGDLPPDPKLGEKWAPRFTALIDQRKKLMGR